MFLLLSSCFFLSFFFFFFFNDTAPTEIYTLSLHDALPISLRARARGDPATCALQRSGNAAPRRTPGGNSPTDRKSTRLNSSHMSISYAVFCLKKKKKKKKNKNNNNTKKTITHQDNQIITQQ